MYALSRSKKEDYPKNVVSSHIDLTSDSSEMAKQLQGIEADYVFFSAYLQRDTELDNWNVNGKKLEELELPPSVLFSPKPRPPSSSSQKNM